MKYPRRFFERVVGDALEQNDFDIEVRCLGMRHDKDPMYPEHFWFESLDEFEKAWGEIEDRNHYGFDMHFTVLPRLRKAQGKKEHPLPEMPVSSCVWVDLDVGEGKPYKRKLDALRRLRDMKPHPNIIVESGTGLHAYWLVKLREIKIERFERLLRTLAAKLDGDSGAARATRLMRVPNTINWKEENGKYGKLAKVRCLSSTRHRFKDLETLWKARKDETTAKESTQIATYLNLFAAHLEGFHHSRNSAEATALCPFHDDKHPSFAVNLDSGLWHCRAQSCKEKGNIKQFCERLKIALPVALKVQRFPRLRTITMDDEWESDRVFQETFAYLTRQIHFTHSWQPVVVTLWAMGTYLHAQFPCYGHLWLNSPTTHSGKSKLLSVLWTICYKALEPQLEPTSAALFRFPSVIGGTLLLDEVDNLDPQKRSEVISILNHYHSNGVVIRATPGKDRKFTLEKLPIYCPKVVAGINNLPTTLQDRCIKIVMHRKQRSEPVQRFMPGSFEEMEALRNQLDVWASRDGLRILGAYQNHKELGVPNNIDDRGRDILEPLFAIASALPACVHDKLVTATVRIAEERLYEEQESNTVIQGLEILKLHYPKDKSVWNLRTESALELFEDATGIETKSQVQALLRKFGFRSGNVRYGTNVLKAYRISRKRLERMLAQYGLEDEAS